MKGVRHMTSRRELTALRAAVQQSFRQSPEATLATIRRAIIEGFRQVRASERQLRSDRQTTAELARY
jgi:hypothetical protein